MALLSGSLAPGPVEASNVDVVDSIGDACDRCASEFDGEGTSFEATDQNLWKSSLPAVSLELAYKLERTRTTYHAVPERVLVCPPQSSDSPNATPPDKVRLLQLVHEVRLATLDTGRQQELFCRR